MNLLSKAFNKMNEILLNTEAEKLLSQLKKELAQKERTVHSQDFEGDRIHHNLPPLFSDLELLEQRIAELETQRIVRKTDFEYYSRLKRTLTFCEVEENKGVRQIDKAAPGLANEESKKRVLLMHYYQLPALRKEILDFGKTKKFDIKLTKGIIDQIARDLIKNESEENRQCQLKKTTPILRRSHSVPAF